MPRCADLREQIARYGLPERFAASASPLNNPYRMFGSAAVFKRCLSVFGSRPETMCQLVMK
jgi:hypothetical protein